MKAFRGWPAGPSSELPHLQSQRRARHDRSQLLLPTSGDTFSLSSLSNPIRAAASLLLFLQRRKLKFPVSCHIAEWGGLRSEVVCRCQSPPTGQRHGSQKMVREDKRRKSFIWADLLREKNVPGLHRLAKQERRHNGGKWRVWQALGGRGLEEGHACQQHSEPSTHALLHTQSQSRGEWRGRGVFCSERYFLQKPGGAKPGRVPRRWGCSVTSPWTNSLALTQRGRTGFLCFHQRRTAKMGDR